MKNQTLQSLAVIYRRIENSRNYDASFQEVIGNNKTEVDFLMNKFNLKEEEALLLAAACIQTIYQNSPEFDVSDLANRLEVNNFEILLQQSHLKSLVEKGFLVEFPKKHDSNCRHYQSAVEIMNKKFALHTTFGQYLV